MSEYPVRLARDDDLPGMLALYRHLNPGDPTPAPDIAVSQWKALLHSDPFTVYVIEVARQLVASCTLVIVPNLTRGARPYAVIENVVTHADYRRRGHGKVVLHAAQRHAEQANCYKVMLATGSRREETLRFYEGAGFTRGGKTYFEVRAP